MTSQLSLSSAVKLNSGYTMPLLGLGVYQLKASQATKVCAEALKLGYTHIDSAWAYHNQGEAAAGIRASNIPRDRIFFTTKVIGEHGRHLDYQTTLDQVNTSLADTNLGYLDLVLIHAPWGGSTNRKAVWRALVECVEAGKVRSIGVSNYGVHHLDELETHIRELEAERGGRGRGGVISVNQFEIHPWIQRDDIIAWCRARGIAVQAYCPIVRGQRFGEPELVKLADKYGKTQAQILLRWGLQRGYVVLVKTEKVERLRENADLYDFELTGEEVAGLMSSEDAPCAAWDPTKDPLEK